MRHLWLHLLAWRDRRWEERIGRRAWWSCGGAGIPTNYLVAESTTISEEEPLLTVGQAIAVAERRLLEVCAVQTLRGEWK